MYCTLTIAVAVSGNVQTIDLLVDLIICLTNQ